MKILSEHHDSSIIHKSCERINVHTMKGYVKAMNTRVNVVSLGDWNQEKENRATKNDLMKYYSLLSFSELINEVSELTTQISNLKEEEKSELIMKSELVLNEFVNRSKENPEMKDQILMMKSLLQKNIELL